MKNVEKGKYILKLQYPEPHREETGNRRLKIENCELHELDKKEYGISKAYEWVKQGKYNLNDEELEIVHLKIEREFQNLYALVDGYGSYGDEHRKKIKEIDAILATKNWDCRKTEAALQWQKAHDANIGNIDD